MGQDFSLHKYFKDQYISEALSRANSKYVTPTTSIPKSTAEYVTDKTKSTAEKETNAMRNPNFKMYDKDGGTEQSYISDEYLMEDNYSLSSDMLNYADQYHMELVDTMKGVSTHPDKRTGGFYVKFPHESGPGPGALFGKDVVNQIEKSKAAAKSAAQKTVSKFKDYIEDYDITDSKSGVYGNVWLWVMPKTNLKENQRTKDLVDGYELDELKSRLRQIYREMEEEAEPEGGPVADQYADEIDAYEKAIRLKKGDSGREMTYGDMLHKNYPDKYGPGGKELNEATDDEIAQALYSVDYEQLEPDEKERVNDVQDEMGDTLLNEVKDDQLSRLLQISKHADIRMGEDKLYKLAMAWENWNIDNDDEYDELVDPLFAAVEMVQDNTAAGMKRANGILKSFNRDIVKVMNSLKKSKFKKAGEESGFDMRGLNESTEKTWNAIDVSRTAEKELSNKEWNERTTKKLDILKKLNANNKFKKDWDEEKLQGWVDQNFSWERVSRQFKNIGEGSCGYTPDGKPRNKPAGPHLLKLKERIFNLFRNQ